MAGKKYTMQFNWRGAAGWSESFFTDQSGGLSDATITTKANAMARARIGCLSNGVILTGIRVNDLSAPSIVRGIELNLPGTAGNGFVSTDLTDVPNLAALVNFYSTNGVRRSYLMRGLTDADVVLGILTFAFSGRGVYNTWWNFIQRNTFIRDVQNEPKSNITAISGNGYLTTPDLLFLPVAGDKLVVSTYHAGDGPPVRTTAVVQSRVPGVITLKFWTRGDCEGGTVCRGTPVLVAFGSFSLKTPAFVRTRQTGPPLGQLPGRR